MKKRRQSLSVRAFRRVNGELPPMKLKWSQIRLVYEEAVAQTEYAVLLRNPNAEREWASVASSLLAQYPQLAKYTRSKAS